MDGKFATPEVVDNAHCQHSSKTHNKQHQPVNSTNTDLQNMKRDLPVEMQTLPINTTATSGEQHRNAEKELIIIKWDLGLLPHLTFKHI
jgi:hypothetical protein